MKLLINDINFAYIYTTGLGDDEDRQISSYVSVDYVLSGKNQIRMPGSIRINKDFQEMTINQIADTVLAEVLEEIAALEGNT